MAPGLLGFALILHLSRALYALHRGRVAVTATAIGWLVVAGTSWLLVLALTGGERDQVATLRGLGIAITLGMTVAGAGLLVGTVRSAGRGAVAGLARTTTVLAAGGASGALVGRACSNAVGSDDIASALLAGVLGAVVCALVVVVVVWLLDRSIVAHWRHHGSFWGPRNREPGRTPSGRVEARGRARKRLSGRSDFTTRHIFVTGGVASSLGKGLTASSLGHLLRARGLRVTMQKLDPYLNVDPGTMNPFQHGEVFVTDDGAETDLDIGHYERFLDVPLTSQANVTTGQVYSTVIAKERRGEYLGDTVQVIPHITNEIKSRMRAQARPAVDVIITEIGGTVGDIESLPFLEAARQVRHDVGRDNVFFLHVSLVPYIGAER